MKWFFVGFCLIAVIAVLMSIPDDGQIVCGKLESGFDKIGIVKEENGELIFCDKDGCRPLTTSWERVPCSL